MQIRGGIDLGGTKIQAVVIDARHRVVGSARRPTPTVGTPADVAAEMVAALRDAVAGSGADMAELRGVGFGSPGAVESATGVVAHAGNLPGWSGSFPLGETIARELGVPIAAGNDVGVAAEAELRLGAGRPYSSFVGVFWGTGVGGAVILNRRRVLGRGSAGEIGHVVVRMGGALCGCGRHGCMEAYAGRGSMERKAREQHDEGRKTRLFKIMEHRGKPRLSSGVWAQALDEGDELAKDVIDRAVEALGAGVGSVVNLLDVEAVIIGGGLGLRLGEPYAQRIAKAMQPHLFVPDRPPTVHIAALGDLGGAIGAALQVRRA